MGKIKMEAKIVRQDEIATDIYSMVIDAPEIASQAVPGQFIDVYSADGSKLLPRPISCVRLTVQQVHSGSYIVLQERAQRNSRCSLPIIQSRYSDHSETDLQRRIRSNPDWRRNRYSTDAAACEGAYLREVDRAWIP